MKKILYAIIILSIGFGVYTLIEINITHNEVIGRLRTAEGVYPDTFLTPGKYDTIDLSLLQITTWCNNEPEPDCTLTYSQSHRNVSEATRRTVYARYGVMYDVPRGSFEVDHFYPLCAGGSNELSNLWLEPENVIVDGENLGYHAKDILEAAVCWGIKNGKIDPEDAYREITKDWVEYYHHLIHDDNLGTFGFEDMEGDTE